MVGRRDDHIRYGVMCDALYNAPFQQAVPDNLFPSAKSDIDENPMDFLRGQSQLQEMCDLLKKDLDKLNNLAHPLHGYVNKLNEKLMEQTQFLDEQKGRWKRIKYAAGYKCLSMQNMNELTELTFGLLFKLRGLNNPGDSTIIENNPVVKVRVEKRTHELAVKASRCDYLKVIGGAALMALAAFGVLAAGCVIAASAGATFGATGVLAPLFLTAAKFGVEAFSFGLLYVLGELGRAGYLTYKEKTIGKSTAFILAGTTMGTIGSFASAQAAIRMGSDSIAINSGIAGGKIATAQGFTPIGWTVTGMGFSLVANIAALCRGGLMFWNGLARNSDKLRQSAEQFLNDCEPKKESTVSEMSGAVRRVLTLGA